ncbi:CAP domain-containing protein [Myxococcaceae bacterium GXIMD 01537]
MIALALSLLLATAPEAEEKHVPLDTSVPAMEQRATRYVLREFERVGRRAPRRDAVLDTAARRLAKEALTTTPIGAPDVLALMEAVSDAGGVDPSPTSIVIRAAGPLLAADTLGTRRDFSRDPITHFGVGIVAREERTALVVLLSERKATIQSFPRVLAAPETRTLCGDLVDSLERAQVVVTRPNGKVVKEPLVRDNGSNFCARPAFSSPGRYTVEVVGNGDGGPEVAAMFLVDVGGRAPAPVREALVEPATVEEARKKILERINTLRREQDLPPLAMDATLERVAQAYSERMAREGFFAHVAPDGTSLRNRMPEHGAAYFNAGENLGMAPGPLAAHFGIEHSPGHRKNLLEPRYGSVGIGIAYKQVDGKDVALLTEVFAIFAPTPTSKGTPLEEAYLTLAQHRSLKKLPPLERSEVLEQLAFKLAKNALERNAPSAKDAGFPVHERVFAVFPDARTATVDFYVVSDPYALPDSRSLATATNSRIGVGIIKGDSPTYGRNQYWVAVIYAAMR